MGAVCVTDQTAQAYRSVDPELSNYSINMINEGIKKSSAWSQRASCLRVVETTSDLQRTSSFCGNHTPEDAWFPASASICLLPSCFPSASWSCSLFLQIVISGHIAWMLSLGISSKVSTIGKITLLPFLGFYDEA